jgi:hypothetical protein
MNKYYYISYKSESTTGAIYYKIPFWKYSIPILIEDIKKITKQNQIIILFMKRVNKKEYMDGGE